LITAHRFVRFAALAPAVVFLVGGNACTSSDRPPSASEFPKFVDMSQSAGIGVEITSGSAAKDHILAANTGGCALLDYDEDGDLDIFFVNGWQRPSRLKGS
jgi:hypothetical protein